MHYLQKHSNEVVDITNDALRKISKMNDDIADVLNDAIEHFPGRIRRQGWVQQAKVIIEDNLFNTL